MPRLTRTHRYRFARPGVTQGGGNLIEAESTFSKAGDHIHVVATERERMAAKKAAKKAVKKKAPAKKAAKKRAPAKKKAAKKR